MNDWALGFWVVPGHLDLLQRAEDVSETEERDLAAGDFARAPGNLCFWDEEIHKADVTNPIWEGHPVPIFAALCMTFS